MIYFVGIKGVGMTALAQVLQAQGMKVMGSDIAETFMTDKVLAQAHISVKSPFHQDNIPQDIQYAVISGAYYQKDKTPTNPEVIELLSRNIPIFTYSEALGKVSELFATTIAVAGSHGKTTTSALLTYTLQELNQNPFGVIGSFVPQFNGNACIGDTQSQYLVVEADEYQNHFLDLNIQCLIILNVDYDHPDYFPTPQLYYQAFIQAIHKLPIHKPLIINGDDETIKTHILPFIEKDRMIITFGLHSHNDITLNDQYEVSVKGVSYPKIDLLIPGNHNRCNALAVIAVLDYLGLDIHQGIKKMKQFRGTQRRLEYKGVSKNGATLIDDYAHHPTEISAGIQALREAYPQHTLHCVFQPHTFSRTESLLQEFGKALSQADNVYILPIYGSAREEIGTITSEDILPFINNTHTRLYSDIALLLSDVEILKEKDVMVTMGAGDVWKIINNML